MKNQYMRKVLVVSALLFVSIVSAASVYSQNMFRKVNDFDGDGKADYAVTRNENGSKYWYIWYSSSGANAFQFGLDTDQETAGDWDNDGKIDISVFRRESVPGSPGIVANNFWYYESSTNSVNGTSIVTSQSFVTKPFQQDYNNDGKTDPALSIENDSNRPQPYIRVDIFSAAFKYYSNGNIPVRLGDMTGDGRSDIVSYSPAGNIVTETEYISETSQALQFGASGDQYVPADFDGDGRGDLTVFRESDGTWWWIRSSDGVVQAAHWGLPDDKPVPADYDGDGKTDLAIWRPGSSQAYYWVNGSLGNVLIVPFGLSTDTPVTY